MTDFKTEIGRLLFEVEDGEVAVSAEFFTEILTIEDVFKLAEFAAAAYDELEGDPYVHTEYDKGELVQRDGVQVRTTPEIGAPGSVPLYFGEGPDRVLIGSAKLERDCE